MSIKMRKSFISVVVMLLFVSSFAILELRWRRSNNSSRCSSPLRSISIAAFTATTYSPSAIVAAAPTHGCAPLALAGCHHTSSAPPG